MHARWSGRRRALAFPTAIGPNYRSVGVRTLTTSPSKRQQRASAEIELGASRVSVKLAGHEPPIHSLGDRPRYPEGPVSSSPGSAVRENKNVGLSFEQAANRIDRKGPIVRQLSRRQEPFEAVLLDLFGRMDSGNCISSILCGLRRVNPHRSIWEAHVVEQDSCAVP